MSSQLPSLTRRFRSQFRRILGGAGLARVAAVGVLLFALLAVIDWRLHLRSAERLVLLALWTTAVAATAWFTFLAPLRRRWSDAEILAYLDNSQPGGDGRLLELYELAGQREQIKEAGSARGSALIDASLAELEQSVAAVHIRDALSGRHAARLAAIAAFALLLLIAASWAIPTYVAIGGQRLFNPFSTVRWPHRTTIDVAQPENGWTVPQLEAFTINAAVTGEVPSRVLLSYRTESSGAWMREHLPVEEGQVQYVFPEVREPLQFTLSGGDYESDRFDIDIIQRPYLQRIAAHYSYPTYVGLPDRTVESGQLSGLEGTQVRLEFHSSMPLDRAVLILEEDPPAENRSSQPERRTLTARSDTLFETSLMLRGNGSYSVELYEKNGYREARAESYEIRVTPDDPPEIELFSPGKDLVETSRAAIDVAFTARDKLGLARIECFYQIDNQPPALLSDRITGPIPQSGSEITARFPWRLTQMELPEAGTLGYFVRVQDNNPTGRGVRQSPTRQIKLVKPSEFHLEALEQAKLLEEEARIAWRNQLQAWQTGLRWKEQGGGAEDDPLWTDMRDAQDRSFAAARQIRQHLQLLTEKYERNDMARDFMAGRLSVISELLSRLLEQEHAPIAEGLEAARPKSAASAEPAQLAAARASAYGGFADRQKMALLVTERLLRKLYDWRDLQTSTITTKLLREQQTEVQSLTAQLAPRTIAKEIEDLSDADQDRLLTLGKQQRAIFDTETGLENQLTYLMYKAEKQDRASILEPLRAAFNNLRNNRVNHHLKSAAEMIENNQPSQIIDSQKAAVRALDVVEAGLLVAGQDVDEDEPLTLSMTPSDASQFDPDAIKPADVASKPPQESNEITTDSPLLGGTELPVLPEGADALSASLRLTLELQDSLLARTRYLDKNRTSAEMPRFVKLKLSRLQEQQQAALSSLDRSLEIAAAPVASSSQSNDQPPGEPSPVAQALASVRAEFQHSQQLVDAGTTQSPVQQLQADSIASLGELLQFIAFNKSVDEAIAENLRLGGVDAFGRKYLLRDSDLPLAVNALRTIAFARQRQSDVLRKLKRLQPTPPVAAASSRRDPAATIVAETRAAAASIQKQIGDLLANTSGSAKSISPELSVHLQRTGIGELASLPLDAAAPQISASQTDETLIANLTAAIESLATTIQRLRDLLEERVQPAPELAAKQQPPQMTPEQFEKLNSQGHLAELLKQDTRLPPEVRDRMVRALAREFPEKYRDLLKAYFASFVQPQGEQNSAPIEPNANP